MPQTYVVGHSKTIKLKNPRNIYMAEKRGEPTLYNLIRSDVDAAISRSVTTGQFYTALKNMGYEVKSDVKYTAVRSLGRERFTRVKTLGVNYTEEAIRRRILRNPLTINARTREISKKEKPVYRLKGNLKNTKKVSGFRALYLSYCYKMGILPKDRQSTKKLHFLLREDLRRMDEILEQTKLLCTHQIDTAEQLTSFIASIKQDISRLTAERTMVVNRLRRCKDQSKNSEYKEQRASLTSHIQDCRNKLIYADGILDRSEYMKKNLTTIASEERHNAVHNDERKNRICCR